MRTLIVILFVGIANFVLGQASNGAEESLKVSELKPLMPSNQSISEKESTSKNSFEETEGYQKIERNGEIIYRKEVNGISVEYKPKSNESE